MLARTAFVCVALVMSLVGFTSAHGQGYSIGYSEPQSSPVQANKIGCRVWNRTPGGGQWEFNRYFSDLQPSDLPPQYMEKLTPELGALAKSAFQAAGVIVDDNFLLSCMVSPNLESGLDNLRGVLPWGQSGTWKYYNSIYHDQWVNLPAGWHKGVVGDEPGILETHTGRQVLHFRSGDYYATPSRPGYTAATIEMAYKFLVCAGDVHFAYSLDKASLRPSSAYILARDESPEGYRTVTPDTTPAAPETFPLDADISRRDPIIQIAHVKDAIAGEALGMGCFTGQTKNLGKVSVLVGPKATPAAIKTYLNSLWIERISNIPFALRHPQPMSAAERATRAAARQAELKKAAASKLEAALMAGQTSISVDGGGEYSAVAPLIEEYNARNKAAYDAEMARHRAAVAASEQARARFLAETVPCPANDGTRCKPLPAK